MEIFLGNGRKTSFWNALWLEGKMPKDIAPKIIELCKRKKWTVAQALHDNEWITKLSTEATISIEHLTQFVQLWALIRNVQLNDDLDDDCWWRGVDVVNDQPVGNPKRRCDERSSKFSLSYETKVYQSSRKKPNSRR
jgi:hypothetical protein